VENLKFYENWFGNRGYEVSSEDFKEIWKDETYIYWIPNNEVILESLSSDNEGWIVYAPINSMYMEIEDEVKIIARN